LAQHELSRVEDSKRELIYVEVILDSLRWK